MKQILRNIILAICSNGITLLASTLTLMLIPMFLNVSDYGYMQMYIFYAGYLGLFNIGWLEGMYLKLGGALFHELKGHRLYSHYIAFKRYTLCASIICIILVLLFIDTYEKKMIFLAVAIALIPYSRRNFWDNVLLLSGEMKFYARSCFFDKASYLLIVSLLLTLGYRNVFYFIAADIVGKIVGFFLSKNACMNTGLEQEKRIPISKLTFEIFDYVKCGINLLIGNLSSMLIVGTFRMAIENHWDIVTYSQMSLTLNISNFILGFINAVSQVLFTLLKRTSESERIELYTLMRTILTIVTLGGCVFYTPLRIILVAMLPKYEFGLNFMAILLPICFIECKWSFLTLTYLKAIREEKVILKVNLITLLLACVCAYITVFLLENMFLTVSMIVVVLLIRSVIGETILCFRLHMNFVSETIKEVILVIGFILINWNMQTYIAMLLYGGLFLVYLISKVDDIKHIKTKFLNLRR